MDEFKLQNVSKPYKTKQEWVYSTLKDAILSSALAPETRLTLDDLAEQLQVSRVPIREALLQLQSEGLVNMIPHSGAVVSPISLDSIHELFMILGELEGLAGRVAAERASPENLQGLEDRLAGMEEALSVEKMERWSALNIEFHREICRLSGMPFLEEITAKTLERWDRIRRYFLTDVLGKRIAQAQKEHRQIYAALKEGDVEAAERNLRTHNRNALQAYLAFLAEEDQSRSQNSDQAK